MVTTVRSLVGAIDSMPAGILALAGEYRTCLLHLLRFERAHLSLYLYRGHYAMMLKILIYRMSST